MTTETDQEAGITISSRANIDRFQDRSSHLVASLEVEMIRARRYGRPLSMLSLTIMSSRGGRCDGRSFKQLNLEKRMRKLAPVILRSPDFWGRIDRHGFLIILTETDEAGADAAVRRLVASEPFQQLLQEESGRNEVMLFAAQMGEDVVRLDAFVEAVRAREVWSTNPEEQALA